MNKPYMVGAGIVIPPPGSIFEQSVNTPPYTVTQADLISGQIKIHVPWPTPFPSAPPMATCTATVLVIQGSNLVYQVLETQNCQPTGIDVLVGFYNGRSGNPGDVIQVHATGIMPNQSEWK
jgi:hypothetical protein